MVGGWTVGCYLVTGYSDPYCLLGLMKKTDETTTRLADGSAEECSTVLSPVALMAGIIGDVRLFNELLITFRNGSSQLSLHAYNPYTMIRWLTIKFKHIKLWNITIIFHKYDLVLLTFNRNTYSNFELWKGRDFRVKIYCFHRKILFLIIYFLDNYHFFGDSYHFTVIRYKFPHLHTTLCLI